eukprot:CAMPEP_0201520294 /NCGR_PEP_ID=MMETSP0161_2-20130828/10615_1 /ASSEMBLY_ACC=CAM_ASM_000251 /TAXON_ID=180227 /ORGANISM="Neoparamoeba aestuarina, Strain SoJaBio B1-5/56/2" /LENGTH=157 /DNA_ID=CAMNT_0047918611 /DNA_START=232 /DNA_END=705 /DNA_ORIENTATION=-
MATLNGNNNNNDNNDDNDDDSGKSPKYIANMKNNSEFTEITMTNNINGPFKGDSIYHYNPNDGLTLKEKADLRHQDAHNIVNRLHHGSQEESQRRMDRENRRLREDFGGDMDAMRRNDMDSIKQRTEDKLRMLKRRDDIVRQARESVRRKEEELYKP